MSALGGLGEFGGAILGDWLTKGQREEAEKYRQEALKEYSDLKGAIPQQLEKQGRSELDQVQVDPSLKAARMAALGRLQQVGLEGGMDPASRAAMAEAEGEASQHERGQREAILQGASSRGMLNSNMTTMAQLQAQQSGADRMAMAGTQNAAAARQRALQALAQSDATAGGIQRDEYGVARDKAGANDQINAFNTRNANQFSQQQFDNRAGVADRNYQGQRQRGQDEMSEADRRAKKFQGYGKGFGELAGGLL